jgi:hypothetical protein
MAKPNYAFAKRQRDLAKKQKKEEKKLRKANAGTGGGEGGADQGTEAADQVVDQDAGPETEVGPEQSQGEGGDKVADRA